jgi:hypothetical protein
MWTLAATTTDGRGHSGHPLWHLLIVAGGAIGLFVAIKTKEHLDRRGPRPARRSFSSPAWPIIGLALLSATAGALHSAVSAEHFQEAFVFGAFFLASSTLQAGWAVAIIYRPSRSLLHIGIFANAATIALWSVTRTVGLPLGPLPWHAEAIGAIDLICTVVELALVIGALTLLERHQPLTKPDVVTRRLDSIRAQHPTLLRETTAV